MLNRRSMYSSGSADYQDFKCARPLDYSFKNLESLEELNRNEKIWTLNPARDMPKKDKKSNRYVSGSFRINNNNLPNVNGLRSLTENLFEMADYLSWLDVSNNNLRIISEEFLLFPNLSMLYLHGNNIEKLTEVSKLRKLNKLKTLTLYNNPLSEDNTNFRIIVVRMLPEIRKLDNVVVVNAERDSKKLLEKEIRIRLKKTFPAKELRKSEF